MDFFSGFSQEAQAQTAPGEFMERVSFSGKDGSYLWKEGEEKKEALEVEKVILFFHTDGQVLWGGNGPLPIDGEAPLCRSEKRDENIAGLRKGLGPATLATMASLGYTGDCRNCGLAKFNGNDKPLCKQSAVLYVANPDVEASDFNEHTIHRVEFNGPAVVNALKERLRSFLRAASEAGIPWGSFVVKLGSEKVKVKGKSDTYKIPTIAIHPNRRMSSEWLAIAGSFCRIALEDSRRRPPYLLNPVDQLSLPESRSARVEREAVDGIDAGQIVF